MCHTKADLGSCIERAKKCLRWAVFVSDSNKIFSKLSWVKPLWSRGGRGLFGTVLKFLEMVHEDWEYRTNPIPKYSNVLAWFYI